MQVAGDDRWQVARDPRAEDVGVDGGDGVEHVRELAGVEVGEGS